METRTPAACHLMFRKLIRPTNPGESQGRAEEVCPIAGELTVCQRLLVTARLAGTNRGLSIVPRKPQGLLLQPSRPVEHDSDGRCDRIGGHVDEEPLAVAAGHV